MNKILILFLLFILNVIVSNSSLTIPNFDVREKFRDCYNDGVSSTYNGIVCFTNWPIQFSMLLTDKLCLEKNINKKSVLSSMNINTCMQINNTTANCQDLKAFYNTTEQALAVVNQTINFFNTNGSQFLKEFPYVLLQEDETQPGYFPACNAFNSSVGNVTLKTDYDIYNETDSTQFEIIKNLIFEHGPILAMIDTNRDINNIDRAIWVPEQISTLKHDGIKFLRVIGWRTLQGKTYWIFSYTLDDSWGLNNYKLIAQQDYALQFINFYLN